MKTIFILLMSVMPMLCYGQIDIKKAFDALKQAKSEKTIVVSSVMPELSIIRQQYRLSRNGKTYGKNNKVYYGEQYALGIKVSNGLLVANSVIEPWKNDADYQRLNTSNQYQPELFWTYQRSLDSVDYRKVDLEFGTEYIHPLDSANSLYVHEEKRGDFGLLIDATPGKKKGYMLWISSETTLLDSAMTVTFEVDEQEIMASEDSAYISLERTGNGNTLGGLFVIPTYERAGRIQMRLVGVAVPSATSDKWELFTLTKGTPSAESPQTDEAAETNQVEPTLIESASPSATGAKGKKSKRNG